MSEPARSFPLQEAGSRAAPGPLRDWLAAMKIHAPAEVAAEPRQEAPQDIRPEARQEPKASRGAEAAWSPRLVPLAGAPRPAADDTDVSELMAENMMLKAKLHLDAERQEKLQAILADEIRDLRLHVRDEISSIDDLRAEQGEVRREREEFRGERERFRHEREELRAERDRATAERDALRAERQALAAERDSLRTDRDLWQARAEALAQPLFQSQKR